MKMLFDVICCRHTCWQIWPRFTFSH